MLMKPSAWIFCCRRVSVNKSVLSYRTMKNLLSLSNQIALCFITLFTFSILGCSNPASSEEEHHDEAIGAILKMNGQEIARSDESGVTGQIEVNAGEETTLISIFFLADDGDEFQPDEPEFSLNWKDIDTSIADVEQHAEDGKWSFHIHGEAEGNTSVVFQLFHDGHSDFDTQPISVVVN